MAEFFPDSHDQLVVGRFPATDLVGRFGSPLYAFDADIIRRRFEKVREALGPRVEVLFALKANPNAAIARVLRMIGAGAEVASAGEMHIARASGFDGAQIQSAGPGKCDEDIRLALEIGLGNLNVESVAEYEAIARIAQKIGRTPPVAVRVNPPKGVSGSRMRMGGGNQKFGVGVEEVPGLVRRMLQEGCVEFRGLHLYAGTQCFTAEAWAENARFLAGFAARVEGETGASVQTLNLGGGFGVPCFENDEDFDLREAGEAVRDLIERDGRPGRRYFVELGRYLVAPAGVYLTRVRYLKETQGKSHAILDGGLHHHSAAAGVGAAIRRAFPVVACEGLGRAATRKYALGGPLCTPADDLGSNVELPELERGDLLAVLVSGAYGLTFSSVMFLSHPSPAEVLVDGDHAHLVREPGSHEDALRGQRLPNH